MTAVNRPTLAELNACMTYKPKVVETAKGPMEYAERGEGTPLL